jgi:hypothetical protein
MRQSDRDECAAGGLTAQRALEGSFEISARAWTALVNDEPVCMFGVTPLDILGGIGSPWLLAAAEFKKHYVTFIRLSKEYLEKELEIFPHLVNFVDARNTLPARWLKWLGFKFDHKPVPYGPFGMPFYRFELKRPPLTLHDSRNHDSRNHDSRNHDSRFT